MRLVFYWIVIVTGWLGQFLFFKRKTFFENRKNQGLKVKGKAIIVSNHKSVIDYMMLLFLFPFRALHCLMAEVLYQKNPFMSLMVWITGGIKVKRQDKDMSFIGKACDVLNKNKVLAIYPEGRIPTNSNLLDFSPSYIYIALKTGAPIIPIYTNGVYSFFHRTRVIVGEKIYLRDYCSSENPSKEEVVKLNAIVRAKILELQSILNNKVVYKKQPLFSFSRFFMDTGRLIAYTMGLYYRNKVKCKKKKDLKIKGGCVVVSNHSSFGDPIILLNVFWRRRVNILTGEVVFDGHPVRSFFLNGLGCIRIDRYGYDYDAVKKCVTILKKGGVVVIFPEGHINVADDMKQVKAGAVLIASMAGVPITPCYIERREKWIKRQKVRVGEQIKIEDYTSKKVLSMKEMDIVSEELVKRINDLSKE